MDFCFATYLTVDDVELELYIEGTGEMGTDRVIDDAPTIHLVEVRADGERWWRPPTPAELAAFNANTHDGSRIIDRARDALAKGYEE